MWVHELLALDGTPLAELAAATATITRRLNAPSDATLTLHANAIGVSEIASTAHIVRSWRRPPEGGTRILRHAGLISGATGSAGTNDIETLAPVVHDPLALLDTRHRDSEVRFNSTYPRDIVAALVADEQAKGHIHLRVAAGTAGPQRDRTYEAGKNIGEIITQLAEVRNGYWFVTNPVSDDPDPAVVAELELRYPDSGLQRAAARFEWGPGTLGNVTSVQVGMLPPVNRIHGFGAGEGSDQLVVTEEDTASIATYGLYEATVQHVDVVIEQTLRDHCTDALRPEPRRTLTLSVATPGGPYVPTLWDDFDVGDSVRVLVRSASPVIAYDGWATVTSATVTVDDQGNEALTGLDVVLPGA